MGKVVEITGLVRSVVIRDAVGRRPDVIIIVADEDDTVDPKSYEVSITRGRDVGAEESTFPKVRGNFNEIKHPMAEAKFDRIRDSLPGWICYDLRVMVRIDNEACEIDIGFSVTMTDASRVARTD